MIYEPNRSQAISFHDWKPVAMVHLMAVFQQKEKDLMIYIVIARFEDRCFSSREYWNFSDDSLEVWCKNNFNERFVSGLARKTQINIQLYI